MTEPITAWRCWFLSARGRLYSIQDISRRGVWNSTPQPAAICDMPPNFYDGPATRQAALASSTPHTPPGEHCTCGWRAVSSLEAMLSAVVEAPHTLSLTEDVLRDAGLYEDRRAAGAHEIPDVIGHVELSGKTLPGHPGCDPRGTLRAAHARVGTTLYLARHYTRLAGAVRRWYPKAQVHVGRSRGLAWLDEIWRAEGGTFIEDGPE